MTLLNDPVVSLLAALALALLFAGASVHKWREPASFASAVTGYDVLPTSLTPFLVRLIPLVELTLALCLLVSASRHAALLASAAVLILYASVMAQALLRGRQLNDCGCGWGSARQTASWGAVWRNGVMAAFVMPIALIDDMRARDLTLLDGFTLTMAIALSALLYALTNRLLTNHYRHREIFHD